jgi:hypothetical protein
MRKMARGGYLELQRRINGINPVGNLLLKIALTVLWFFCAWLSIWSAIYVIYYSPIPGGYIFADLGLIYLSSVFSSFCVLLGILLMTLPKLRLPEVLAGIVMAGTIASPVLSIFAIIDFFLIAPAH